MRNVLGWLSRFIAIFLASVVAILQLSDATTVSQVTIFFALLTDLASQTGLFVSPWATAWSPLRQKVVLISMMPSIFWLLRQTYIDVIAYYRIAATGPRDDLFEHSIEIPILMLAIAIYLIESIRMSGNFFRSSVKSRDFKIS